MHIKWYHIVITFLLLGLGYYLGSNNAEVVTKVVYEDKPVPYRVDSIIYKTDTLRLPQDPIDTNAVVTDYFRDRYFDTTVTVNEVKLKVEGSIFENRLQGLDFNVSNLRPIEIHTIPKWEISGGAVIGNNLFAPSIYSQYANHELGLGYNIVGEQGLVLSYKYTFWRP